MNSNRVLILGSIVLVAIGAYSASQRDVAQPLSPSTGVQIITLTQTGCQFLESERVDYKFDTTKAEDCQRINGETLSDRQQSFSPLQLAPGEYIFRVTNRDVPYELGFYLRGAGLSQATLPQISGGGMLQGTTQEYRVSLRPGRYVFSCPLNPTPDYPLVVQ
jgi:hypothetical protein